MAQLFLITGFCRVIVLYLSSTLTGDWSSGVSLHDIAMDINAAQKTGIYFIFIII